MQNSRMLRVSREPTSTFLKMQKPKMVNMERSQAGNDQETLPLFLDNLVTLRLCQSQTQVLWCESNLGWLSLPPTLHLQMWIHLFLAFICYIWEWIITQQLNNWEISVDINTTGQQINTQRPQMANPCTIMLHTKGNRNAIMVTPCIKPT